MEQTKDPAALARSVVLWIYINLAAQIAYLFGAFFQLSALSALPPDTPVSASDSLPGMAKADAISGIAGLVLVATFLVSGFLILKWIYRTNANAQTLATGMGVSPGWNIGWFFVPLANLWKPFQGVAETWQVSHQPKDWEIVPVPALLRWWWACWLISNFIDNGSFRLSMRSATVDDTLIVTYLEIASGLVSIPLALLLISVVRQLTAQQIDTLNRHTFA